MPKRKPQRPLMSPLTKMVLDTFSALRSAIGWLAGMSPWLTTFV